MAGSSPAAARGAHTGFEPDRGPRFALVAALLGLAVAAVYAQLRDHGFVDYDDMAYLVWNPDVEPTSLVDALRIAFTRSFAANWVPLTLLSHQLDRWLFGDSAPAALAMNAALHALASALLFGGLRRLSGRTAASAFAAAVFALHPLHVESVAWAVERRDVLSGVCFGALLWLYARYVERPESSGRYRAVLLALALGLMSKPTMVTAPCVLLLLDAWPLRRLGREALVEKWPMFAMVAGASWMTLRFQGAGGALEFGAAIPLWARTANALQSTLAYLGDFFWPAGLTAYYPHPGTGISLAAAAAAGLALAAITAAAWALRRSQPWWAVGWLWFAGMLVPVSGLVQVGMQARADRYTYLPLIGLAWALGLGVDHWARTPLRRRAAAALATAILLALGVAAHAQVDTWRDSRSLYGRMRDLHPQAGFPELRLGMVEVIEGRFEAARPHLVRALERDPGQARWLFSQLGSLAEHQLVRGLHAESRATLDFGIAFALEAGDRDGASALRLQRSLFQR